MKLNLTNIFFTYFFCFFISCNSSEDIEVPQVVENPSWNEPSSEAELTENENSIPYTKDNGVMTIPVTINGIQLNFIFDSGASVVCMSSLEATLLVKQGAITIDDITGQSSYLDASGNVNIGTTINLKEVKVGTKILTNITANVVDNEQAPLLLGGSVLREFGTITIDQNKEAIIFE